MEHIVLSKVCVCVNQSMEEKNKRTKEQKRGRLCPPSVLLCRPQIYPTFIFIGNLPTHTQTYLLELTLYSLPALELGLQPLGFLGSRFSDSDWTTP